MNSGFDRLRDLGLQIRAMSRTESPAELFKALRDACRLVAPRGSVFLVRQGKIRGWSAFGYDPVVLESQRGFSCAMEDGWLGALVSAPDVTFAPRTGDVAGPDFGQLPAAEAVGSVVRIQGKPVALLVAERDADESPWHPEASGLLATVAQLRLELDLALRKLQGSQAPQPGVQAEEKAEPGPGPAPGATPVAAEATGLAPAPEEQAQEPPELEAARRYARLVATDIRLYNEEAVVLGRRNGDLDRRLARRQRAPLRGAHAGRRSGGALRGGGTAGRRDALVHRWDRDGPPMPGTRSRDQLRGHGDLQEIGCPPRGGCFGAPRSIVNRNRFALPCSGPVQRKNQKE